jgi:hypothetical protein
MCAVAGVAGEYAVLGTRSTIVAWPTTQPGATTPFPTPAPTPFPAPVPRWPSVSAVDGEAEPARTSRCLTSLRATASTAVVWLLPPRSAVPHCRRSRTPDWSRA